MRWTVSADASRLSKDDQERLAYHVCHVLLRNGHRTSGHTAYSLVLNGETAELFTQQQVIDACQLLQDANVRYQIHKTERVDIDICKYETRQAAVAMA